MGTLGIIFTAVVLIVIAIVVLFLFKRFLVNTVLGVIALLLINFFGKPYGLELPLSIINVIITGIFGLAGVGALLLLKLLFGFVLH